MRKFLIGTAIIFAAAALFVACKKKEEAPTAETAVTAETAETAEIAMEGDSKNGLALFMSTELGTTGKSCDSCHPNGGGAGMEMEGMTTKPLIGVKDRYPGEFAMAGPNKIVTLAEVVNFCITNPLGGQPLPEDSQEMKDLLAYLESL